MGVVGGVVTYVMVWWVVFFALLPVGVRSQDETGEVVAGSEPGAPVAPNLWRKAGWATLVATGLWAVVYVLVTFELVTLGPPAA